ncbi:A/G-specific adenine glycosylase [Dactylosporangium aurantiacum]|uniref:Adenine DNA glycosylase n=1 Tax=Dactylosporangium aurantiacum TaxID=35754 RepID=A0A9Q9ITM3_9ACTN|nr:A/G-specific adenine glycosylase [Dactylosporangium aurantiacum]MDG6100998.1 A/G-specific adenine glycosylase [Dactylosporangium aurantiacum]UWZ59284.1 A/G-specific adenine glycosylase [Dactylosporangium aurantiacum]
MASYALAQTVTRWFDANARDLPWRQPDATAWGVLVSEVMLQQTQVSRVDPAWRRWMERWPTPAHLAADPPGEAIRAWDRLGYPRRALRLHACATAIVERHGGVVPDDVDALLALPGIGMYTARAVAAFAFRQRHPVVDTNVRRVVARIVDGAADGGPATTPADLRAVEVLLPEDPEEAARASVAFMELGAVICTARAPRCEECPVRSICAWRRSGAPAPTGPSRRTQRYHGTDRHVRGLLLAVLRASDDPVPAARLDLVWDDEVQRGRALRGLLEDGLVRERAGTYTLPG